MNLHIKIKHLGGNKTEREKTAKHIVWCHAQGAGYTMNMQELLKKINLPPGSIVEAAEQLAINISEDVLNKLEDEVLVANE